jgi:DNA polymerase-3 subunit gamma/tau
MAEYLVLARKYRSNTFDEVVGQEPIARTLVSAIEKGRIHHAYLFTGTRGVGKTTMARILAKALNCLASDAATPTPCGKCDACLAIARGDDMDVVEIDGASNRGIDEIRELRANAIFRPARSRYKIYYIDEVHQITRDAFNALLKTLEEPPPHVKFIFATTEGEKVPATILSRCQRFDFRNIPTRQIAGHLKTICKAESVKAQDDALFRIARAADGSMRDALSLLDQLLAAGEQVTDDDVVRVLGTPPDERTLALATAIANGAAAEALKELDAMLASGVSLATSATALGELFRSTMLAAVCGEESELVELPEAHRKAVGELARRFSTPVLVQTVAICQAAARAMRGTTLARALLEATVVRLAEAEKFIDPASLLERLESLAAAGPPRRPTAGTPPDGQAPARQPHAPPGSEKKKANPGSA